MADLTLETLASRLPPREQAHRTCRVDLSDLLGDGFVLTYREPSLADLFACSDAQVLREWERAMPDIPTDLAATLELMARLHLSPPAAEMPTGKFYSELIKRLEPSVAVVVIKRISDAIADAFGLSNLFELAENKKKPSSRGVRR